MRRVRAPLILLLALVLCVSPAASAAGAFSDDPDAIERAAQSVLMLEIYDRSGELFATGSGFVAFDEGTLVTNAHVIEDAYAVRAYNDSGEEFALDRVFVEDADRDVAILGFSEPSGIAPLELDTEAELKRAQTVVAIGSPIGIKNTVSIGNISALYMEEGVSVIQFTAPISDGSSGGALLDDAGKVIGITSATYVDAQNINIAVHVTEVAALYETWDKESYRMLDGSKQSSVPGFLSSLFPGKGGKPTPRPTEQPDAPATGDYAQLQFGDEGAEVERMQKALIALGYLDDAADGVFGRNTLQAVIDFKIANGLLRDQGYGAEYPDLAAVATRDMLRLLYEGDPAAYAEPAVGLYFLDEAYAEWAERDGDLMDVRFEVTNIAMHKTVKSFELYAYATDRYDDPIYGDGIVYYWTTNRTLKPGETAYSDDVTMSDFGSITYVYCGVHTVVYTDGTYDIVSDDDVEYAYWELSK